MVDLQKHELQEEGCVQQNQSLQNYKTPVENYLIAFSSNLKGKEILIWKDKLVKTRDDVHAFLREKKKPALVKNAAVMPCTVCTCSSMKSNYMEKIDNTLVLFSTIPV